MCNNTVSARFKLAKAMHEVICSLNDEGAYMTWIYLVPDDADDDDLMWFAEDESEFDDLCRLFNKLIKRYGKSGYCFGVKAFGCDN